MEIVAAVGLAELGYLERELSSSVQEASRRLPDDDLGQHVRTFGEEHARYAEEVDRILRDMRAEDTQVPDDFKASVHRLTQPLAQADGAALLVALLQAEQSVVDFYEVPLGETLADEQAVALRRQQHEEQRHLDFLESRGAIVLPELADMGLAGGEGSAEDV